MKLRMSRMTRMQRIDRLVDPARGLARILADELRDVVERQRDRVDALDDAVVQVAADPVALVDHRQALHLLVQPRVVDGDPACSANVSTRAWSSALNSAASRLLVRYRRPTTSPDGDRHAEERVHRRMVGREAVALRMRGDVRDPVRPVLADDQPQQAWPRGRSPIAARCSSVIPLVMNCVIGRLRSTMPSAAYCAATRSRTRSTMSCRTWSTSRTPLMPRTAASSASSCASRAPLPAESAPHGRASRPVSHVCQRRARQCFGCRVLRPRERVVDVAMHTVPPAWSPAKDAGPQHQVPLRRLDHREQADLGRRTRETVAAGPPPAIGNKAGMHEGAHDLSDIARRNCSSRRDVGCGQLLGAWTRQDHHCPDRVVPFAT